MLTVFVIANGEPSAPLALALAKAQGYPTVKIDRVEPVHCAFNRQLELCETEYFVQVEADMVLFPGAVEHLATQIGSRPDCAEYVAPLWGDLEERPIWGVKIYRHSVAARHKFRGGCGCDQRHAERLRMDGWSVILEPKDSYVGVHLSLQGADQAERRGRHLRRYGGPNWDRYLVDTWQTRSALHQAAHQGWTQEDLCESG